MVKKMLSDLVSLASSPTFRCGVLWLLKIGLAGGLALATMQHLGLPGANGFQLMTEWRVFDLPATQIMLAIPIAAFGAIRRALTPGLRRVFERKLASGQAEACYA
jgi:hypothetical protein